jgi:hypothetical protein
MHTFIGQHLLKRTVLAIAIFAGLTGGTTFAGSKTQAISPSKSGVAIPKAEPVPTINKSSATKCRVDDPDITDSYTGECVAGAAHGKGVAKGRDEYKGEFNNGNKHGQGTYTWGANSKEPRDSFVGEFIDDIAVKGIVTSKSGETFKIEHDIQTRKAKAEARAKYINEIAASKALTRLLTSAPPEEVYLAGVKSETESDNDRASTLYNHVITNFAKAPVALKAADRLLAIKDKLDMQKKDFDATVRAQKDAENRRIAESEANYRHTMNIQREQEEEKRQREQANYKRQREQEEYRRQREQENSAGWIEGLQNLNNNLQRSNEQTNYNTQQMMNNINNLNRR